MRVDFVMYHLYAQCIDVIANVLLSSFHLFHMIDCKTIKFISHAIQRMFERDIRQPEVLNILSSGEIINQYPDDKPFPSYLVLGHGRLSPIHVVIAIDQESSLCIVVTVYIPSDKLWEADFRRRKEL